jgi:GH24 family phage-related lysozyme (muramidase)
MDKPHLDDSITAHEGYSAKAYKDSVGLWTFAVGRCLEKSPLTGAEWKWLLDSGNLTVSITPTGAQFLTDEIEAQCIAQCKARLPNWAQIDDVRQNAIIEFCYQLGSTGALAVFADLCKLLAVGDWEGAAKDAEGTRWYSQTPVRGKAFCTMLRTGQWIR